MDLGTRPLGTSQSSPGSTVRQESPPKGCAQRVPSPQSKDAATRFGRWGVTESDDPAARPRPAEAPPPSHQDAATAASGDTSAGIASGLTSDFVVGAVPDRAPSEEPPNPALSE